MIITLNKARVGWLKLTTAIIALLVGAIAGIGVTAIVGGASTGNSSGSSKISFPLNVNGQTYGSSLGVGLSAEPDLILAVGTNGRTGYISRKTLWAVDGTDVTSPSQASAYMSRSTSARTIPVFEKDGTTVIGSFVIPSVQNSGGPAPTP